VLKRNYEFWFMDTMLSFLAGLAAMVLYWLISVGVNWLAGGELVYQHYGCYLLAFAFYAGRCWWDLTDPSVVRFPKG